MDQIDSAYKVLSISRQCKLLGISRRQYYYEPSSEQNEKKFNLLVKIKVIRDSNQVWSTDITYIKLPTGNVYLIAIRLVLKEGLELACIQYDGCATV